MEAPTPESGLVGPDLGPDSPLQLLTWGLLRFRAPCSLGQPASSNLLIRGRLSGPSSTASVSWFLPGPGTLPRHSQSAASRTGWGVPLWPVPMPSFSRPTPPEPARKQPPLPWFLAARHSTSSPGSPPVSPLPCSPHLPHPPLLSVQQFPPGSRRVRWPESHIVSIKCCRKLRGGRMAGGMSRKAKRKLLASMNDRKFKGNVKFSSTPLLQAAS